MGWEMDSAGQDPGLGSGASQQTRLSEIFRTVHSNFTGLVKNDRKPEDVVITSSSQIVRKKPLLVIDDFARSVAPGRGNQRSGARDAPLLIIPSVNAGAAKKRNAVSQPASAQKGVAKEASDAGARAKRKAAESEDGMWKRVHARLDEREVPFPTKPDSRKETESHSSLRCSELKVPAKKVAAEQDRYPAHEPFAGPESLKGSRKVNVVVHQNRNRVQAPPSRSSVLPGNSSSACKCDVKVDNERTRLHDPCSKSEIDSGKCTPSERRHRKDIGLSREHWSLPVDLKGDGFSSKLRDVLREPFDSKKLSEMWDLATRRLPVLKLRQTRGRTVYVPSEDELGLSYLDHHPDLARRIEETSHPAEKLALLRSLFFWLQHSCMEGAFKPWSPQTKNCAQEGDCVLTDGPDCEVLAVVLSLDAKNKVSTVEKPLVRVVIDLSDDDEDDRLELSQNLPVNPAPKRTPVRICGRLQ